MDSNLNSREVSVTATLDNRSLLHNYEGGRYMQKDVQNKETAQRQEHEPRGSSGTGDYGMYQGRYSGGVS